MTLSIGEKIGEGLIREEGEEGVGGATNYMAYLEEKAGIGGSKKDKRG